ncbi:hypothetical protein VOLCADRAFT_101531, partial [Volvox carteri f. nagariensis]
MSVVPGAPWRAPSWAACGVREHGRGDTESLGQHAGEFLRLLRGCFDAGNGCANAGDAANWKPGREQPDGLEEEFERGGGSVVHVHTGEAMLVGGAKQLIAAAQLHAATALPNIGNKNNPGGFHGSTLCCEACSACVVGGLGARSGPHKG